ncbi:unnamed protein product [Moneuplotes crassus]|uniref:Uncharacterized protein n=1 Tax=Euplotes crassus TaxID=5936 RepID=A0AAD1UDG6_EUPCR|nr:unnamed protein product [Moneuplotes crassus]
MEDYRLKFFKWTYEKVKNIDMFKQTVNLTYKGKYHFSNCVGALCTLGVLLALLVYAIVLFRAMFKRTNVSWNHNSVYVNLAEDQSDLEWAADDPEFKMYWMGLHKELMPEGYEPEQLGVSEVYSLSTNYERDDGIFEHNRTTFDNFSCDNSFPVLQDKSYSYHQVTPVCPQLAGQKVQGRVGLGKNHKELNFGLMPCIQSSTNLCVPQNQMEPLLSGSSISVHLMNRYVDLNDIDNPIKRFYDDEIELVFKQNKHVLVDLKLRQHEVILEDSLLPTFSDPDPIYFNSIEDYKYSEEEIDDPGYFYGKVQIRIRKDSQVEQHRRKVLNFLEVTGILGGLFEVFEIGVGVLIGLYSSFIFKRSLYKDISKYEQKFEAMEKCIAKLENKIQQNNQNTQSKDLNQAMRMNESNNKSQHFFSNLKRKQESKIEEIENLEEAKEQVNYEESKELNMEPENVEESKLRSAPLKVPKFGLFAQTESNHETIEERKKTLLGSLLSKATKSDTEVEKMKESLDCLNIVYMIKVLRRQTQYLLFKDSDYQSHLKSHPELDFHCSTPLAHFQPGAIIDLCKAKSQRIQPYRTEL